MYTMRQHLDLHINECIYTHTYIYIHTNTFTTHVHGGKLKPHSQVSTINIISELKITHPLLQAPHPEH